MKLYSYYEDFGRMGSIESLFFSSQDELEALQNYRIEWDELLGKHSDGRFDFTDRCVQEIVLPEDVIKVLYENLGKVVSGPLDFDYFIEQIEEQKGGI